MKNKLLIIIAIWLILDGIISIYHFYNSATQFEQAVRLIRTSLGIILLVVKK